MFHQVKSFKVKLGLLGPKLAFRFKIDTRGNKETTAGIKKKADAILKKMMQENQQVTIACFIEKI